jgi:hypothetical protein
VLREHPVLSKAGIVTIMDAAPLGNVKAARVGAIIYTISAGITLNPY